MNEEIIKKLEIIFTKTQALVYLYLLNNPNRTVYQISKDLEMSRSTVYPLVEAMYAKGYLLKVSSETISYYAEKPQTLLMNIRSFYNESLDELDKSFATYQPTIVSDYFMNLSSYNAIICKAKELLLSSQKEVYFNTDIDLEVFDDVLKILDARNIRVIFFCFRHQNINWRNVDAYTFDKTPALVPTRLTLVIDKKEVLAAGLTNNNEWVGTLTNNQLMINLISEHIHHDIYLYKIQKQLPLNGLFSKTNKDNILINSQHEINTKFYEDKPNDQSK